MMDKTVDLSIVIPVYNHEKYIEKCLKTILYDLPENSEIIIIDDCSTDSSMEIVKKIDSDKIKIFKNEKNMGCAYSLNKAMDLANGKYIGTNNSDDFVQKGFYKQMLKIAKETDADVVCANIADYNDTTKETIYNKIDSNNLFLDTVDQKIDFSLKKIEVKAEVLLGHWTASSASTKIIKKELFEKYKYIGSKANDLTAIYPIMTEAKKVIYMPQLYMFYRQVPNSLSRRSSKEEYNSVVETIIETMKRMEKIQNSDKKMEILFFNNCLSYFINVLCKIDDMNIKNSAMKYFITEMKKYKKNIFKEMKKSIFFKTFKKHNQMSEATYNLLNEEAITDFLIKHKLDVLLDDNEMYLNQNYNLNQKVIELAEEKNKLKKENNELKEHIETLKTEIDSIKKSTSWKITKPIRDLKMIAKNVRRKH